MKAAQPVFCAELGGVSCWHWTRVVGLFCEALPGWPLLGSSWHDLLRSVGCLAVAVAGALPCVRPPPFPRLTRGWGQKKIMVGGRHVRCLFREIPERESFFSRKSSQSGLSFVLGGAGGVGFVCFWGGWGRLFVVFFFFFLSYTIIYLPHTPRRPAANGTAMAAKRAAS